MRRRGERGKGGEELTSLLVLHLKRVSEGDELVHEDLVAVGEVLHLSSACHALHHEPLHSADGHSPLLPRRGGGGLSSRRVSRGGERLSSSHCRCLRRSGRMPGRRGQVAQHVLLGDAVVGTCPSHGGEVDVVLFGDLPHGRCRQSERAALRDVAVCVRRGRGVRHRDEWCGGGGGRWCELL